MMRRHVDPVWSSIVPPELKRAIEEITYWKLPIVILTTKTSKSENETPACIVER
jgi:hypothetical protein